MSGITAEGSGAREMSMTEWLPSSLSKLRREGPEETDSDAASASRLLGRASRVLLWRR
jgi:hypothetical protein